VHGDLNNVGQRTKLTVFVYPGQSRPPDRDIVLQQLITMYVGETRTHGVTGMGRE